MLGGGMNGSGGPDVCGDCITLYIKQDKYKWKEKQRSWAFYCNPEARPRAFGHQNVARGDDQYAWADQRLPWGRL